jgi:DinB family protein
MTKRILIFLLVLLAVPLRAEEKKPATLRELLLAELRSTHNNADWFVPGNTAVKGLTAEQASWTDGKGNHSVGQITHHLVFWNRWSLERLNGSSEKYNGTNDETFYKFDAKTWSDTVRQFDEVMNDIEKWVQTADEAKLKESAQTISTICTHNAYHIGQIIYVRREQGSWDPNMGVK